MSVKRPTIPGLISAAAILYGLLLCLVLVVRALGDGESTLIALMNVAITLLLMPSLVMFPLGLVLRQAVLAVVYLPPFAAFMLAYLPLFLPRPTPTPPADAIGLSLLTYNLHAERHFLQPMLEVIAATDASIVTLQEMSPEAAAALETDLAPRYPYRALFPAPDDNPYHGRGLLSRYPITQADSWPVEYPIPLRLMRAVVTVNGIPVTVYNFHAPPSIPIYGWGFNVRPRGQQINAVLAMIAAEAGAVLWMGDFNTSNADVNYPRIAAHLHDAFAEAGWGMGFTGPDWSHPQSQEGPSFIPLHQRFDYIFYNAAFTALQAQVWPDSGGSDHRAVFAQLALLRPTG